MLNLCCDLDFEYSNPIFSLNTSAYDFFLLLFIAKLDFFVKEQQFIRSS